MSVLCRRSTRDSGEEGDLKAKQQMKARNSKKSSFPCSYFIGSLCQLVVPSEVSYGYILCPIIEL